MEIEFADDELAKLCNDAGYATRRLGSDNARKLRARLADLSAAECVTELIAGRPHPLKGKSTGSFALSLHGGCRLVFVPDHEVVPKSKGGGIDWRFVTRVRITFIGDYHE